MRYFDDQGDVDLPFPSKKFRSYLKELEIDDEENIDYKKKKLVFLKSVRDFLLGKNSLDDVSSIAGILCSTEKDKTSDLASVLMSAEEMGYYIRRDSMKSFEGFFKDVMDYYNKHKALIE